MEDNLKKIMQPKTIKNKRVVAPLRVTLLYSYWQYELANGMIIIYKYCWWKPQPEPDTDMDMISHMVGIVSHCQDWVEQVCQ